MDAQISGTIQRKKNGADQLVFEIGPQERHFLRNANTSNCYENTSHVNLGSLARIRESFEQDGFVLVRGLLDDATLTKLVRAGESVVDDSISGGNSAVSKFTSMKFGPLFLSPPPTALGKIESDVHEAQPDLLTAFREVALLSVIPALIATLLLDLNDGERLTECSKQRSLRVLKDAFLAKGGEGQHCGWHVDDFYFWPTSAHQNPGVNAWVCLDDIPSSCGGGLAVSPRSHNDREWRNDAYKIIGSTKTFPEEGHERPDEIFGGSTATTCTLATASPELAKEIDGTAKIFDYKCGDVLFMTRWLFHRSVPLTEKGFHYLKGRDQVAFKRYTIRYEPGDATLLKGFTLEPSVLHRAQNAGKSLDDVCSTSGPWYPKCWPQVDPKEMAEMKDLVEESFPVAQTKQTQKMKEMARHLSRKQ